MSASNGEHTVNGQQRDLMIQAAMADDETQKRHAGKSPRLLTSAKSSVPR